jgi:hypothetical protein
MWRETGFGESKLMVGGEILVGEASPFANQKMFAEKDFPFFVSARVW